MKKVHLSARLLAAASLVKGGVCLADIGTDHAYLPITLVQRSVVPRAVAADIRPQPLMSAEKNIREAGLSDRIETRLSDGLRAFLPGEADEFVFAGMGGTLIAEKMRETPWVKDRQIHFVFQPQSRAEELREYLFANGFCIGKEVAVHEGKRFYIAFDAVYDGQVRLVKPSELFLGKLPPTEDAAEFILRQRARLLKKEEALQAGPEKETLTAILNDMDSFLKGIIDEDK